MFKVSPEIGNLIGFDFVYNGKISSKLSDERGLDFCNVILPVWNLDSRIIDAVVIEHLQM